VNEALIEECLSAAADLRFDGPEYWLLMVRLAEATLLCAGNYADNCQFTAAGDLIVNPREILVYRKPSGRPELKNRHVRLSDQFGDEDAEKRNWKKFFPSRFFLEVTKPPLLPLLTKTLKASDWISSDYIQRLDEGQQQVAKTLTFLNSWRVSDAMDLWTRLRTSSVKEKNFVKSHLCKFGQRVFRQIGVSLRRCLSEPNACSPFLSDPSATEIRLKAIS
jgi:hypothetical protein